MGVADDIIKYNKRKRKKNETVVDDIVNGTFDEVLSPTRQDGSDDIAPVFTQTKKEDDDTNWFSDLLKNTVQTPEKGNILTNTLGTLGDIGMNFGEGIWNVFEGIEDLKKNVVATASDATSNITKKILGVGTGLDSDSPVLDVMNNFVKGQVISNVTNGKQTTSDELRKAAAESDWEKSILGETEKKIDRYSYAGSTTDQLANLIGYSATMPAGGNVKLSAAGKTLKMPTLALIGGASGSLNDTAIQEAEGKEVTETQRWLRALGGGAIEGATEGLFGLFGAGGSSLDDAITDAITTRLSSSIAKTLAKVGISATGEATEEFLSYAGNYIMDNGLDKIFNSDLSSEWNWEELGTQMALAFVSTGISQGATSILTKNQEQADNQAQIEGLQQEIARETEELNKAQDAREKQIRQEKIDVLNEELNELSNAQQITDEKELRKQNFTYEAQETDSDIRKAVYESASQVMNNTEKAHKFVDVVAKIADEKGTVYKFTNNEQLKQLGYAKEGITVNGLVNENGEVLINIDSAKELNTVVGHETTHLLEGTKEYEALKQMAIEYSKTKGDYDARIEKLTKLYEGTNADIEAELTSDIVGEYLFTDENFVRELSIKQPTVFEKIRNFISDLIVRFKGTDQEKQLRQLQRTFEKAYKAQGTQTSTDTKYSLNGNYSESKMQEFITNGDVKAIDNMNRFLRTAIETETDHKWKERLKDAARSNHGILTPNRSPLQYKREIVKSYMEFKNEEKAKHSIQGLETYSTDEINSMARSYIQEKLEENGIYDVTIKGLELTGSRKSGTARVDSDLDVVVEFEGDIREDDLFDILNEDPMYIDDVQVDINPITASKTGTLEEFMATSNKMNKIAQETGKGYKDYSAVELEKLLEKYSLSTTDNQGRTLTKEQQEYFKDSKVRDENGNLLTVYHGTKEEFTVFDKKKAKDTHGKRLNLGWGKGVFYVTPSKNVAENFANLPSSERGKSYVNGVPRTMEMYANITNPFILETPDGKRIYKNEAMFRNAMNGFLVNDVWFGKIEDRANKRKEAFIKMLKKEGYDGILNGDEIVVFEPNQVKNVDNTNPTTNPDIRYSLSEDTDIDAKINSSMTMEDARKMIQLAFNDNNIEEWYDGQYKNGDEWLEGEGVDDIVMYVENTESSITKYLNPLGAKDPSYYNGDYTLDDIIEAYKNKTLTGEQKQPRKNLDTSIDTGFVDDRFYAPQNIELTKELYDKANQRATSKNKQEVYKARADFIIAAHNPNAIENLGLDIKEVNKKLRDWSAYTKEARELSQRFNDGVARQNQWSGLENSSLVNKISVSNEQMESLVKEIKGNSSDWQRDYITSTMLAIDTHIDYTNLTFEFDKTAELRKNNANGDYDHTTDTIRIGDAEQNTVAHEIGHYIDHQWAREIFGNNAMPLSERAYSNNSDYNLTNEQKQFIDNFRDFIKDISDSATLGSKYSKRDGSYWQRNTEVFARFTAEFTEWVKNKATNNRYSYERERYGNPFGDNFTERQYREFVKILQEKSMLDTNKAQYSLSAQNEEIAPTGQWNVRGEDIKLQVEEAIAPLQETIENLTEQLETVLNSTGQTQDDFGIRNGEITVYHGSPNANINNLSTKYSGSNNAKGSDKGILWFTPDKQVAEEYYSYEKIPTDSMFKEKVGKKGKVYEAKINLKNPLDLTNLSMEDAINIANTSEESLYTPEQILELSKAPNGQLLKTEINAEKLKELGYDGIIAKHDKSGLKEYGIFDDSQIINGNNAESIDIAPTSQDIVEQQGQEAFNHITDEQAPSWEDAVFEAMDSGDFEYSSTEHIPSPLDSRDIDEVGNRKVKAYQYENPEVKPYFQAEAQNMLYDLDNTIKGEKGVARDELGNMEYYGITRQTTEAIAYLKDNYGYSYEQIRQGLNKIIEDDGKENNAVSKRIEFLLDERLREGYTTSDGYPIPPNEDYINFLNEKQITEYNKEAFNALSDADVPLEQATINVEPKTEERQQVIPQQEKTAQNGNTSVESIDNEIREINKTVQRNPNLSEAELIDLMNKLEELSNKRKKVMNPVEISKLTPENASTTPQLSKRRVAKGNKLSSFYENVTETTQMLSKETREYIAKDDNVKFYQGITNEQSLAEAYNRLQKGGEAETIKWLGKDAKSATATDVAEGWILLKQYQDAGDYDSMVEVAKKMREMGTAAGQAVQAFNIMSRLTPEGMVKYAQSELTEAYNRLVQGKTKEWIRANQDKFTLKPQETAFILNNMKEVQNMEDGYEKKVKLAEIQKMMQDKIPPELGQSIRAYMRISMLLNPKTQVRNVFGNVGIMPVNVVADTIASRVDKMIAQKTNVRTTGNIDLAQYAKGFKQGVSQSYNDFKKGINTRNMEGNRFEVTEGRSFNDAHALGKIMNKIDNFTSFLLDGGDRGFYEGAFMNSINNQKVLNNTDVVTQEMIDIATSEALQRTWQDNNNYTKFVMNIRQGLNNLASVKGYGLGDVLIPFAKTPANLTKAIIDYSPIGLVTSITKGNKLKNAIATGQFTAKMQHDFVQDLGKATAGTMLYVLGYALASAGAITGSGDDDKDVKNFLKNTMGVNPYSIKIGDTSFTYDWAQPIAAPFAIMANVVQKSEEGQTLEKAIENSLDVAGNVLFEQSFMESINTVLSNNDGLFTGLIEALSELPSRAVPTFAKQIADMVDGTQRQSFVYDDLKQTAINKVTSKIPYMTDELAPSVNTLGDEIEKYGGDNSLFNVFLNPSTVNKEHTNEVAEEIYRLYQETGDKTIMPRQVGYYVDYKGEKIKFTNEQRAEFQTLAGTMTEDNIRALMNSDTYNSLNDTEKAEIVADIVNYSYNKAQSEVIGTELSETYKSVNGYRDVGGNVSDYYLFNHAVSNADSETKKETAANTLIDMSITDQQKAYLYTRHYSTEEKANIVIDSEIPYDYFLLYDMQGFTADKDSEGNSISGSKKEKVFNYINDFDLDIPQKVILFKMEYPKDKDYVGTAYNEQVVRYVDDLGLSFSDVKTILEELGMEVDDEGYIYW